MTHHDDQPGRKARTVLVTGRVLPQPMKVVLAQRLAHVREDVHDVVVLAHVVTDRSEDEPPVPVDELVPGLFLPTLLECDDPTLHERVFTAEVKETSARPRIAW